MTHDLMLWFAGFIDGEGCFHIRCNPKQRTNFVPIFQVVNVNEDNMKKAKEAVSRVVGREIRYHKYEPRNGQRPYFQLRVHRKGELETLCVALLPYLAGKKENAEVMLEFVRINHPVGRRNPDRTRQSELLSRMRHLNRRYAKGEAPSTANDLTVSPETGEGKV